MFNNGLFGASDVKLTPCGLLSVVTPQKFEDARWLQGFDVEVSRPGKASILVEGTTPVVIYDTYSDDDYFEGAGFTLDFRRKISGLQVPQEDVLKRLEDDSKATLQYVVETVLWDGPGISTTSSATFLADAGGATVVGPAGGSDADVALRHLEDAIRTGYGRRGTIHMTRAVASELGSRLLYKGNGDSATEDRAITRLGTRVVIGTGYSGNGPTGATGAAASATNHWMYVTGEVEIALGAPELLYDKLAKGFKTDTNDFEAVLQQDGAVYFDPSIWAAARVTLS